VAQGYLALDMHNYVRGSQWPNGDNNWFSSKITSLANVNGGTVNGQSTGFKVAAPSYREVAVWVPPLNGCDVLNASGLWPSVAMYTDPVTTGSSTPACELDLF
jgi:hypothetical protein